MKNEPSNWGDVKAKIMQRHTEVGDCWEWQSFTHNGRPVVHFKSTTGKNTCAPTRLLVAKLWDKKVPTGFKCVPSCGNPLCVNPEHIKVISQRDHLKRASKVSHTQGNEQLRAAKIAETRRAQHAKLDWEKVNAIRESEMSHRKLGAQYGVSLTVIGRIKRNEAWREHNAKTNPFAGLFR